MLNALAEPNRLRIVELLREGPYSVGEIAARLPVSQPQVSKHLKVLNDAGIVAVQPVAQRRIYRLRRAAFTELDSWVDSFRSTWEGRMDMMESAIKEMRDKS